jgi:molybdopterin converting factor small subunit
MTVRVKLFAAARELAGAGEIAVDVGEGATVADVERAVLTAVPALDKLVSHARWAVDESFASPNTKIGANSQVALIPPVSGG